MNSKVALALTTEQQDQTRRILRAMRQQDIWIASMQVTNDLTLLEVGLVGDEKKIQKTLQARHINLLGRQLTIKTADLESVNQQLHHERSIFVDWQPPRELELICAKLCRVYHELSQLTVDSLGIEHTLCHVLRELMNACEAAPQPPVKISIVADILDVLIVHPFVEIWQNWPRFLQATLSKIVEVCEYAPDNTHFDRSAKQFRLKVSGWQLQKMHSVYIKFDILRRATCADVARKIAMIALQNDAHELKTKNGQVEQ